MPAWNHIFLVQGSAFSPDAISLVSGDGAAPAFEASFTYSFNPTNNDFSAFYRGFVFVLTPNQGSVGSSW